LSQVPHSEASNCRERGAGRQQKRVWGRGGSKEKTAAAWGSEGEEGRGEEKAKGGRNSLGSEEEDLL